jgi:hypothetical protein
VLSPIDFSLTLAAVLDHYRGLGSRSWAGASRCAIEGETYQKRRKLALGKATPAVKYEISARRTYDLPIMSNSFCD